MQHRFSVSKVKCQGCAQAIRTGLAQIAGVRQVTVDVPSGTVEVEAETPPCTPELLVQQLAALGYPVRD